MKFTSGKCSSDRKLYGMIALITGGSSGIGKETARDLCRRGCNVVITSIDMSEAYNAKKEILNTVPNAKITVMLLDLRSFKGIKDFARSFCEEHRKLDILVNNAGVGGPDHLALTEDGIESQVQTNFYGPVLLTCLLLDLLKHSDYGRIINLSSTLHLWGKIDFDNMKGIKPFNQFQSYCFSKIALILFSKKWSEELKSTAITINCVHPGLVNTTIFRDISFFFRMFIYLGNFLMMKTPIEGAQTSIYVAVSEEVSGVSGEYFADCKPGRYKRSICDNKELRDRFYNKTMKIIGFEEKYRATTS